MTSRIEPVDIALILWEYVDKDKRRIAYTAEEIVEEFAAWLKTENKDFPKEAFRKACGLI